jgi:flagellum-specific ATP synthase
MRSSLCLNLDNYHSRLDFADPFVKVGTIRRAVGLIIESLGPPVPVGTVCEIPSLDDETSVPAEVIGFRDQMILSMPLRSISGVRLGDKIYAMRSAPTISVAPSLLGRVIDGLGEPIDHHGPIIYTDQAPLYPAPINPLRRENITEPISTGIRCIDGMLTCGRGQRLGIFGGSGVGKSTLLGMISRFATADVNVIALIGERGREVPGFLAKELGPDGLAKSVVIVSTSDCPPLLRIRGAMAAGAIAEYFKNQGKNVLLIMDSITRLAMAQREVGLASGEPPTSKGYTPSVFTLLPRLVERAGNFRNSGSITGFYTVLVEGDDFNEPISDAVRSLLDGHIMLSRQLAWRNHYPCIDVLSSVSRLMPQLVNSEHRNQAGRLRELLSAHKQSEDLINIGAYVAGSNPRIDEALHRYERMQAFLKQDSEIRVDLETTKAQLAALFE